MPQLRPRLLLDSCLGRNPRPHDKAAALADSARAPNFPQSFQPALCRRAAVISRSCSSTDSGTSQLSHSSKREDMLGALKQSSVRSTCRKDLPRHQVHPRRDLTTLAHCSSISLRLGLHVTSPLVLRLVSPVFSHISHRHDTSMTHPKCSKDASSLIQAKPLPRKSTSPWGKLEHRWAWVSLPYGAPKSGNSKSHQVLQPVTEVKMQQYASRLGCRMSSLAPDSLTSTLWVNARLPL